MDVVLEGLSHYGLPGVVIALFAVLYVSKDRELKRERDARIDDAKAFSKMALELQEKAIATANRLTEVFTELQRQNPRRSS